MDPVVAAATDRILGTFAGHLQSGVLDLGVRLGLFKVFRRPCTVGRAAALLRASDEARLAAWAEAALAGGWLERAGDRFVLAPGLAETLLDGDWAADLAGLVELAPALAARLAGLRADLLTGPTAAGDRPGADLAAAARFAREFHRRALEVARESSPSPSRVLELAAGTGRGLLAVHQVFPKAWLVAQETDGDAVAEAERRLTVAGIRHRVAFRPMPPEDLELDEPASLALLNLVVHGVRDWRAALIAVHEALADGGVLVVSELAHPEGDAGLRSPAGQLVTVWRLREAQLGLRSPTPAELGVLLEGARFTVVRSERVHPLQQVTVARA